MNVNFHKVLPAGKIFYLLLLAGVLTSFFKYPLLVHNDSQIREEMLKGFLETGEFIVLDEKTYRIQPYIYTISKEKKYPNYLPAPSFLGIPFYLFYRKVLKRDDYEGLIFLNFLFLLGILTLFFKVSNILFSSTRVSVLLSLLLLLGGFLLYYQKTFFTEIMVSFYLLFLYASLFWDKYGKKELVAIGFIILIGAWTKYVFLLCVLVYLSFIYVKNKRVAFKLLPFFVIALLGILYYKRWRFLGESAIFPVAYGLSFYFKNYIKNFIEGFLGFLISPGKGVLWLNPLVLWGFFLAIKTKRREYIFPLVIFITLLLFYSGWHMWWGGVCWGPRFLLPALLLMYFPLGEIIKDWRKEVRILKVLFILSIMVTLYANFQFLRINDLVFYKEVYEEVINYDMIKDKWERVYQMTNWNLSYSPLFLVKRKTDGIVISRDNIFLWGYLFIAAWILYRLLIDKKSI